MAKYIRQEDDIKYRCVYPNAAENRPFEDFTPQMQTVDCDENAVLEVVKADGSSHLHYNGAVVTVEYRADGNKVRIGERVPVNRLWLRRKDGIGICYKVPAILPVVNGCREVLVSDGTDNVELFLDKYAAMAYDLKSN